VRASRGGNADDGGHPSSPYVADAITSGLIGAAVVAVWFLVYNAARQRPLRDTLLHGVVFAMIGILIAYLSISAQRRPSRGLALFIAALCLEVTSLAVVVWLVDPVLSEVGWWAILVGNALAAVGVLTHVLVSHRALLREPWGPWSRAAREGSVAGALGAAVVATWFLLHDLLAGAPLRTPALLSGVLLHGLRDAQAVAITVPLVLQYTVVHGLAFIVFGCAAAGLLALADREPRVLLGLFMLFCCFEVFGVALISVLAEWLFETLAWWTILTGNLLAAVTMLGFLAREHRVTMRQFLSASE